MIMGYWHLFRNGVGRSNGHEIGTKPLAVWLCFSLLLLCLSGYVSAAVSKNSSAEVKGVELITDQDFRNAFLKYATTDLRQDYRALYGLLSAHYLKKYFPSAKSAEDFYRQQQRIEVVTLAYLEITGYKATGGKRQVDVWMKTGYEGQETTLKVRYIFVKEGGTWKLYDGDELERQDREV